MHESSNATGINGNQSNNDFFGAGAVYVFVRSENFWSQQAYIKASNTQINDQFGSSISLSGDGETLAVGARNEDSNATGINGGQLNNSIINSGAVYVFVRSGTTWSQQAYVKASNTGAFDNFGNGVSLSSDGNVLAVSASGESSSTTGVNGNQTNDSALFSGAAYIFVREGSVWSQKTYIKASNTDTNDFFGLSVSLSANGELLAVSSASESSNATGVNGDESNNSSPFSGAVYIFQ